MFWIGLFVLAVNVYFLSIEAWQKYGYFWGTLYLIAFTAIVLVITASIFYGLCNMFGFIQPGHDDSFNAWLDSIR